MLPRSLTAILLLLFVNSFANAGVMLQSCEPSSEVTIPVLVGHPEPASVPQQCQSFDQDAGLAATFLGGSSVSAGMAIMTSELQSPKFGHLAERLRLWNATLPTCPFLDCLLRPA